ncbi:Hypothetical protein, putative [Bodo saltans]|uniref:Uncharacterized protein n=1 Tax=Bodo saltans TaxID=75058 RepID=A0A0S4JD02_BODSA|nr:Hypothetical protein, putative [Bodo saltans]|eukprot:CUG88128.1 Hypothetical protein, putative [Bodo saltans]
MRRCKLLTSEFERHKTRKQCQVQKPTANTSPSPGIETAVKCAFTREFNKTHKTEGMHSVMGRTGAGLAEANEESDDEVAAVNGETPSRAAAAPVKAASQRLSPRRPVQAPARSNLY